MDTIVVSPLVKIIGEKLGSALLKEFGLSWGVKKDLEALESTISTIRDGLDVAEQCCLKNKQVYNWLRELKEVVSDAENILDEIDLEAREQEIESHGRTSRVINYFVSIFVYPIKRFKLGHKIKSINKRLDTIAAKKIKFHLPITAIGSREEIYLNRETLSMVEEDRIYGRESEREEIMSQLKRSDGKENISIISIVGLGGLGKTTLARLAYKNDDDLKGYFELKIWIYVSQDFNVGRILRAMIESISQIECKVENLDALAKNLTRQLSGKRFLLVLDDIWNENPDDWEKLKVVLKCGAPGCKIIATTRSIKVSQVMESNFTFELNGLSDDLSWTLFKQRVWSGSESGLHSKILEIAKEIVKKCGGVPLALNALGWTMKHKKTVKEWKEARDSDIWKICHEDRVMASLRLSFMNLSSQLKECFAYCSIFPKGEVIYKHELIGQWMALGLVTYTRSMEGMEVNKGNECFDTLVQASFLQKYIDTYFEKEGCNMHDLVHDLARSVVAQELLVIKDKDEVPNKNAGHIYMSLMNFDGKVEPTIIDKVRALHINGGNSSTVPIVSKAKRLRSIVFKRAVFDTLSISFSKFDHLRCICILNCEFTKIPDNIGALWSLQTLILRDCDNITFLPESIGRLVSIRTLELFLYNLKYLPESIGQCQSLENLIVGSNQIKRVPDSVGKLINLKYLNLSLCRELECLPESIGNLHNLCDMKLSRCYNLEEVPFSIGNLVNLEILNLFFCRKLKYLPESIGNLHNLCDMNLSHCDNLEEVPFSIGNLVNLEILNLFFCTKLEYLPESIGNLDNLRVLNLQMSHIKAIPSSICELQNLKTLNLSCSRLQGMPIGIGKLTNLQELSTFCKGKGNEYALISELEHLNFLSGYLEIPGLAYLNDPREATQANLKEKKNLDNLALGWGTARLLNDRFECWLPVLEALQPPSTIKSLLLDSYPGAEYPNWMLLPFPYLTKLCLTDLQRCSSLPSLAELPHLRCLYLTDMERLTNFSGYFPSLVELELYRMVNLEELMTMNLGADNVYKPAFPSLSKLDIKKCPKLRMQPQLPPSVVTLCLRESNEELLPGAELFDGDSCSLRELQLWDYNSLPERLRHLSSLRELTIMECRGLHVLPEWLGGLKSLESLYIWGTAVTCLPKSMQQLTALQVLDIDHCTNELKRRCEREKGEDWHLISHIPDVRNPQIANDIYKVN